MSPEQLERVKKILDEALERAPADRAAYIEEADLDETIRHEVESLLAQEGIEVPLLAGPIFPHLSPGQRIGPYEILSRLGKGGMGMVVLARREDFKNEVALKVIRPGLVSSEAWRRFHDEPQMLARLEHPNVARILDGGTTPDGHPYFVMEYIKGEPIDDYCRNHRLSIDERVGLFRQVCAAVQVAHRHLIVHRDLKPGNILVTADGTVKLLDFGIAKQLAAAEGEVLATVLESRPMTLLYASPEQIEGRRISTASDVYSLGVLFYELLTGLSPYSGDLDDREALAQAVRGETPRKPSTAVSRSGDRAVEDVVRRQELVGDLDSIALKALAKKPQERYGSVEQLSEDLRRHLAVLPVSVRKGTFTYLAWKFVRRRRLPLAAVTALVVFAFVATFQWYRAVRERERREVVVGVMSELFWVPILKEARGEERRVQRILESSLDKVDMLEAEPPLQAEILQAAAATYAELGEGERALELRERAVRLLRDHFGREERPDLARAINNLATSYYRLQRNEDAEGLYREALAMKTSLPLDDEDRAKSMSNLATILMDRGELGKAEPLYREALSIREKTYTPGQSDLATSLRSLANLLYLRGEPVAAEPLLRRALEIRRQVYGADSKAFAAVLSTLGRVLLAQQRTIEAEELLLRTLEIRRRRYGEASSAVAATRVDLAAIHLDRGEVDLAEELLTEALEILRLEAPEHWQLPRAESLLGALRMVQGRYSEAEPYLLRGVRKLAELRGEVIYTQNARHRLRELEGVLGSRFPSDP